MENTSNLPFDNSPYILALHKPCGVSSYDCIRSLKHDVFKILGKGKGRRKLKIGHFGTLDPFAEGVLLIGTGKALKLMKYFQEGMSKTYVATGSLSHSTDTGDCEGELLKKSEVSDKSVNEVDEVITKFLGPYEQVPPYFSAVKHEGRPLYEWAREGVFIEKPAVARVIHKASFIEKYIEDEDQLYKFSCEVSSGTYIRGLWSDMAVALNAHGHLLKLCRTAWGQIRLEDCVRAENMGLDALKASLKRPDTLWSLSSVNLNEEDASKFCHGQFLMLEERLSDITFELGWVYGPQDELLGLGEVCLGPNGHYLKVAVSLT